MFPWPIVLLITLVLIGVVFVQAAVVAEMAAHPSQRDDRRDRPAVHGVAAVAVRLAATRCCWRGTRSGSSRSCCSRAGLARLHGPARRAAPRTCSASKAAFDSIVVAIIVAGFFTAMMIVAPATRNTTATTADSFSSARRSSRQSPLLAGRDDVKETLRFVEGRLRRAVHVHDGVRSVHVGVQGRSEALHRSGRHAAVPLHAHRLQPADEAVRVESAAAVSADDDLADPRVACRRRRWRLARSSGITAGIRRGRCSMRSCRDFCSRWTRGCRNRSRRAGLLTGIWLILKSRYALAALVLGVTLLVRETSVIVVVMMVLWLWLSKREWRGGFIVGLSIGVAGGVARVHHVAAVSDLRHDHVPVHARQHRDAVQGHHRSVGRDRARRILRSTIRRWRWRDGCSRSC